MKTKYTRKQITEAIKHWKNVLKQLNESSLPGTISIGTIDDLRNQPTPKSEEDDEFFIGSDEISENAPLSKIRDQLNADSSWCIMTPAGDIVKVGPSISNMEEAIQIFKKHNDAYFKFMEG